MISAIPSSRDFAWRHPEWWSVGLSGAAWVALLSHSWLHARHRMGFSTEWSHWMLMVTAMMLPLLREQIEAAAVGSLWHRRNWAIVGFLFGYLAMWGLVGVGISAFREWPWASGNLAAAVGFAGAVLWQLSPWHGRGLRGCHRRVPLAPEGWRADWDCLRFGWTVGRACVMSCWAVMAACALSGHGLLAMGAGMAVGVLERRYYRPRLGKSRAVMVGAAVIYAGLALL